ncbi:hypothetical protein [Breoghania sp. L-A4]|uniref:hypothetical protein n=1 Tax=Breoghania sp. L-A4 TaxID=2304600 RepID=UPI00196856D6|nr:hypothetical protein [Breoghania sp. L-A4]
MIVRLFGWTVLAVLAVFLINNYLNYWQDLPGVAPVLNGGAPLLSWVQLALYGAGAGLAMFYVFTHRGVTLRQDSQRISDINAFLIRAAFWAVLLVGLADMVISFLRVEGLLDGLVGHAIAGDLGRSHWRGTYIHMPLIALSIGLAAVTRTLGFPWLALLVVGAELLIVLGRFIFSYEQAFMADLVRFWYAALFLFASAYTLLEEGMCALTCSTPGSTDGPKARSMPSGRSFSALPCAGSSWSSAWAENRTSSIRRCCPSRRRRPASAFMSNI